MNTKETQSAGSPASAGSAIGWAYETMMAINRLTPEVKEKAFDPDWFLLRQRLEQAETVMKACELALRSYRYGNSSPELAEEVADKVRDVLNSPNSEIRHGGPETPELKPQRNPPLPRGACRHTNSDRNCISRCKSCT